MQFKATGEVKINIAVLAYSNKLLWDCRNFLYAFRGKTKCGCYLSRNEIYARRIRFGCGSGCFL